MQNAVPMIAIDLFISIVAKVSSLKLNGVDSSSNGQVINLLANDCSRFEGAMIFLPYVVLGPLQALVIIFILMSLIDASILSGMIVLVVAIPSQLLLSKAYAHSRYIDVIFFTHTFISGHILI